MSRYRAILAAGLLVAALGGVTACHRNPSYPVQATYAKAGPYATTTGTVTDAAGKAIYDEYYPANYAALPFKSPIVTWGNGTGGKPANTAVFFRHLASYGFTIIATTLSNTGGGTEIDAAARYLISRASMPGSVFYRHLDTSEVAAVGLSQGATGAVRAATIDPSLYKTVMTFSLPNKIWSNPNSDCPTKADCTPDPAVLIQPIFFISTHGPFDAVIASPATERAYFCSTAVHAALGIILLTEGRLADHPSIGPDPGGFLGYATAWLEYQLRGNSFAARAFTGRHPELLRNPNWPGSAVK